MSKPGFSNKFQTFYQSLFFGGLGLLILWPNLVWGQVLQLTPTLSRQPNEEFDSFVQRAKALTATTLKKRFDTDKNLNQLRVVVIGENNGSVAPLLQVTMSRQQWLSSKNPETYIDYFPDSKSLLDFQLPQPSPSPDAASSGATPNPPVTPEPGVSPSVPESGTQPNSLFEPPPSPSPQNSSSPPNGSSPSPSPAP